MSHHLHHLADRAGLPFGVGAILGFATLDWVSSHGLSVLSGVGMVVGTVCTVVGTVMNVGEKLGWWERRKRTRRGA